jgi:hypothetical protein
MTTARPSQMNLAFEASKWGEEGCAGGSCSDSTVGKSGAAVVSLSAVRAAAAASSDSVKAVKERSLLERALQSVRFF